MNEVKIIENKEVSELKVGDFIKSNIDNIYIITDNWELILITHGTYYDFACKDITKQEREYILQERQQKRKITRLKSNTKIEITVNKQEK